MAEPFLLTLLCNAIPSSYKSMHVTKDPQQQKARS